MRAPRGVVLCLVRIQCLFFIAERNGPRREAVGASENSRMKRSSRERVGLFLDANNARAEVFFFLARERNLPRRHARDSFL